MKLNAFLATFLCIQNFAFAQFQFLTVNTFKNAKGYNISYTNSNLESVIPPGSVLIGKQIWQSLNLNVSKYKDGTNIPKVSDPYVWATLTTGAYCYYNNDSTNYAAIYGKLYNWHAVNDKRGLCPKGWHIPSKEEWKVLETTLGGFAVAGGKMKEAGTQHWNQPNAGASNSSGFNAMPSGYRMHKGKFMSTGLHGFWWTSSELNSSIAWYNYVFYNGGSLNTESNFKQYGFSVRCIKD